MMASDFGQGYDAPRTAKKTPKNGKRGWFSSGKKGIRSTSKGATKSASKSASKSPARNEQLRGLKPS
jgi:hypothetical protein